MHCAKLAHVATREGGILPKTITAAVIERLRGEIRDGTFKAGQRLRQAHLAELYGVSTTPVREAFAALEREGLVQSTAHRGVVVFGPTPEDLREIYEIRIPLEALATEWAVPNLTKADLAALAKLLNAMEKSNHRGDLARSVELNNKFHTRLYAAAGRKRLFDLIAELRAASLAYTGLFSTLVDEPAETESNHRAIYDACLARDPKQAGKAMIAHLQRTVDVVSKGLAEGKA